jgi:hypothetical protein
VEINAMKRLLILNAAVLLIASCRGATSETEQQTTTPTAVEASGPLAIAWTDADLEKDASRIGYGSKPEAILARDAEGALVFTPQTPQDHVATPFTSLQTYEGRRSLELVLDVKADGGDACVGYLQDQAFVVLATVPCRSAGEHRVTANLGSAVTGIRVYFLSAKLEPVRLPARMQLTERR